MKKIFLPLVLGLLVGSCRENSSVAEEIVVPEDKTTVLTKLTENIGGKLYTTTFEYESNTNKLAKIVEDGEEKIFTYEGGRIVKMVETDEDSKKEYLYKYVPNSDKLEEVIITNSESDTPITKKYTYKNDNEIIVNVSNGDEYHYTLFDGNIIKKVEKTAYNVTVNYTYDDKNNPLKNIKGTGFLMTELSALDFNFGKNNVKIEKAEGSAKYSKKISAEYDSKGFPTKRVEEYTSNDGKIENITYQYHY